MKKEMHSFGKSKTWKFERMLRGIDVTVALAAFIVFAPLLLLIAVLGWVETSSPIFVQERVGQNGRPFNILKFRTMPVETPNVPTHKLHKTEITSLGKLLRKTKLDEFPQLLNVLRGEMSLVGPRPSLPTQSELITERNLRGVLNVKPGITGLAQIHEVDMSDPVALAEIDASMIRNLTLREYFRILLVTAIGKGSGDRLSKS